jgi:ferredoxin-nitrite reductase
MEKLNKLERLKADLKPADFDPSVVNWSDPSEEDRFYLKNYGIYNIKMRPEFFMLRLRIDGGRLRKDRLLELAQYVVLNDYEIIITARAQMEVHHIPPERIMGVYLDIVDMGFETRQTLTDNFRAITTDPYDGLAADSCIECKPIIDEIVHGIIGQRKWMGQIPRKFNTSLIGRAEPMTNPWSNDLLFALSRYGGQYGFNIYIGGKNNQVARDADIFVTPRQAPSLFLAVANTFQKHGLRASRSKNRLHFLIEKIGIGRTRDLIEGEFGSALAHSGELLMQSSGSTPCAELSNGKHGRLVKCHNGEVDGESLIQMLDGLDSADEVRFGSDQNIHLIETRRYQETDTDHARIICCAGHRYCPLSLWDIKHDDGVLPLKRIEKLGISVGFSGCLKGCARHMHSDIGLVGLRTNMYGDTERALRVYIGATQGEDARVARMLYYSVPERSIDELIGTILDEYESSELGSFEDFSRMILGRYEDEFLQLWFLAMLLKKTDRILSSFASQNDAIVYLSEHGVMREDAVLSEMIRRFGHQAWGIG